LFCHVPSHSAPVTSQCSPREWASSNSSRGKPAASAPEAERGSVSRSRVDGTRKMEGSPLRAVCEPSSPSLERVSLNQSALRVCKLSAVTDPRSGHGAPVCLPADLSRGSQARKQSPREGRATGFGRPPCDQLPHPGSLGLLPASNRSETGASRKMSKSRVAGPGLPP